MTAAADPRVPELWRIVLLEDDEASRHYFERCIRNHGTLELQASFGRLREAIAWLEDNPADLLLTDLVLPDGHGLELIFRLKALQPQCETLVISVLGDEDTVLACVEAGAVGYIHKDSRWRCCAASCAGSARLPAWAMRGALRSTEPCCTAQ